MLKKAYFLKKSCKNCFIVGDYAPEPPFASGGWGRSRSPCCYSSLLLQICRVSFMC